MEFFEAFGGLILVLIIVVAFYRHPIRREPDIIERQRQSLEEAVTLFTAPTDDALWKLAEQRKEYVSLKAVSDEYNRLILDKVWKKVSIFFSTTTGEQCDAIPSPHLRNPTRDYYSHRNRWSCPRGNLWRCHRDWFLGTLRNVEDASHEQ
ncbi:MAG: hypothetical protein WBE25_05325 [Xanthobacteraceae bacterium]